jgi:hypothetical protein
MEAVGFDFTSRARAISAGSQLVRSAKSGSITARRIPGS